MAHIAAHGEPIELTGEVIDGRPDFSDFDFGKTRAKKGPKYVFSTSKAASLVHVVSETWLDWWVIGQGGRTLHRRVHPRVTVRTLCGNFYGLGRSQRSRTCEVPDPAALVCKACLKRGRNFKRVRNAVDGETGLTRQQAAVRLGCLVRGY